MTKSERRQKLNKILHTYLDVNQYEDYTDYKALLAHLEDFIDTNYNEKEAPVISWDLHNGTTYMED